MLEHQPACRVRIRRLVALPGPRQIRGVVRVVDDDPPRDCAALVPECIDVRRCALSEVEVDMHRGTVTGATEEPGIEVDESGANELAVLECGVARDVRVVDGELDDLRGLRATDEGVD